MYKEMQIAYLHNIVALHSPALLSILLQMDCLSLPLFTSSSCIC